MTSTAHTGRSAFGFFLLLLTAAVMTVGPADAQVVQSARYELIQKLSAEEITVVSMNERGIALIHQVNKYEPGENTWEVILLDSALQQNWSTEFLLDNRLNLIGYEFTNDQVYFIFRKGNNDNEGFHLVKVDAAVHLKTDYDIQPKLDFKITHFSIVGNSALMGGYVSRQPTVVLYDLRTGSNKVVPGFFIKNSELIDLRINRNNTFNTLLLDRGSAEKKLVVRTFDESGAQILEDVIDIDADKSILSGLTSTLDREELLVAGTWGIHNGKTALGYYTVLVDPFNQQQIRYYSFADFNRFLENYIPKKANRIKARTARRKKEGKLPGYSLYVNPVRIAESKDGFTLLSEVYSASSGQNSGWNYYNPSTSPYGYGYSPYGYSNPYGNRYSPFPYGNNSVQRTDVTVRFSSVVSFDGEGKLADDTGQKVDDIKLPNIDQVSDFIDTGHEIIQIYREKKNLNITITDKDEKSIPEHEVQPIRLKSETDVLRSENYDDGSIRSWFGHSLFLWGYESIKDPEGSGGRHVFYINKISTGR